LLYLEKEDKSWTAGKRSSQRSRDRGKSGAKDWRKLGGQVRAASVGVALQSMVKKKLCFPISLNKKKKLGQRDAYQ